LIAVIFISTSTFLMKPNSFFAPLQHITWHTATHHTTHCNTSHDTLQHITRHTATHHTTHCNTSHDTWLTVDLSHIVSKHVTSSCFYFVVTSSLVGSELVTDEDHLNLILT